MTPTSGWPRYAGNLHPPNHTPPTGVRMEFPGTAPLSTSS